jgi:ribosomal protein S18 acetylase RimI-like enzyme
MLKHVMDFVEKDGNFDSVFLHVQVNNESALSFYRLFGFDIVETKEQYYKRIEPADAHVLEKKVPRRAATTAAAAKGVNGDKVERED